MEDGTEALASVESKLASVFTSEVAREGGETPEQPVEQQPDVLAAENVIDSTEIEPMQQPDNAPEPQAEAPSDERPRDEQGRFISQEEQQERLYAGRYKTVEELERAVEEKEAFIARQGTDIGSVRQELEALRSALEQPAAPAQPQALPSNWETLVEENPAAAIEQAYKAGNEAGIQEAYRAWDDIAPGAPQLWYENKMLAQQVAGLAETHTQQASSQAYERFARSHPDVDQYASEMVEIAKQYPHMMQVLQSGDPASETEVLDFLYTKASTTKQARNADTLAQAQSAADADKNALLRQQKENAAVASATKSAAEKKPLSEGHQMLEQIRSAYGGPDILSGITTD